MSFLDKIKEKLPFSFGGDGENQNTIPAPTSPVDQLSDMAPESQNQLTTDSGANSELAKPKSFSFGEIIKKIKGEKKDDVGQNNSHSNEKDVVSYNPLIESAVESKDEFAEKALLDAPEIEESLLEEIEPPKSLLLYVLKGVFIVFLIIGAATYLFFATQLGTRLKFATDVLHVPAAMVDLIATNDELKSLRTDLNVYNLLEGKFHLDNFSFEGDKFIRNYQIYSNKSVAEVDRNAAKAAMVKNREILKTELVAARDKLLTDYHVTLVDPEVLDAGMYPKIFEELLIQRMGEEIISREGKTDIGDARDYKTYVQAKKLITNTDLKDKLKNSDIDNMKDKELVDLIIKLNGLAENELSAMQKIKDAKIKWSAIITEIKSQTRIVDQFFNEGLYDEAGGIQYTNYDFDASTKKITITGTTKRYDSANFTTISDLIDQLNASPLFQGVEMKSFAKSGSSKEGYTATLRLSLELQKDELTDEDARLDVDAVPEFLNSDQAKPVNKTPVTPENTETPTEPNIKAPVIN